MPLWKVKLSPFLAVLVLTGGLEPSLSGPKYTSVVQVVHNETSLNCSGVPDLGEARAGHVSFLDEQHLLISCGGWKPGGSGVYQDCVFLNPVTVRWEHHSRLATDRVMASHATIGGRNCIFGGEYEQDSIECLDPSTKTWHLLDEVMPGNVKCIYK